MALLSPVDIYCERLAEGLMAEPLNAISNLSFILAAWLLWKLQQKGTPHPYLKLLTALVFLVGLGSLSFHTFAIVLTGIFDVLFIVVFTLTYLYCYARLVLQWRMASAVMAIPAFLVFAAPFTLLPRELSLNGSIVYAPCLFFVLWMAMKSRLRNPAVARLQLQAAMLFAVSIAFRASDMALCPSFALGTHFIWHTLNGIVLYLLVRALIVQVESAK